MSRSLMFLAVSAALLGAGSVQAAPRAAATVPDPAAVAARATPARPAPDTATRIPEPDSIALYLMAAAGLLVGRRLSRTRSGQAPGN